MYVHWVRFSSKCDTTVEPVREQTVKQKEFVVLSTIILLFKAVLEIKMLEVLIFELSWQNGFCSSRFCLLWMWKYAQWNTDRRSVGLRVIMIVVHGKNYQRGMMRNYHCHSLHSNRTKTDFCRPHWRTPSFTRLLSTPQKQTEKICYFLKKNV